jgi:hypothetical protein
MNRQLLYCRSVEPGRANCGCQKDCTGTMPAMCHAARGLYCMQYTVCYNSFAASIRPRNKNKSFAVTYTWWYLHDRSLMLLAGARLGTKCICNSCWAGDTCWQSMVRTTSHMLHSSNRACFLSRWHTLLRSASVVASTRRASAGMIPQEQAARCARHALR